MTPEQFNELMEEIRLIRSLLETKKTITRSPQPVGDIEERKNAFKEELWLTFKNSISVSTLKEFFEYWTEPSTNKKKLRFEMEKAWDLKRRMATWLKNGNKIEKSTSSGVTISGN